MVMVLLRGMRHPDPKYLAATVMEAKCIRLEYGTRLSRLHNLDPPVSISLSKEKPFSNSRLQVRK
jgi:hypothetical protein